MPPMSRRLAAATAAFVLGSAGAALAAPCPPGIPPGVECGAPDAALAPAGAYAMDAQHTAILARVAHIGYSYSVFRFDRASGQLTWDPKAPAKSKLTVSVETASIATPVAGFADQLAGPDYLDSKAFPTATFTSTAFRPAGPTRGQVDGELTFRGKTRPFTFQVELVGAGGGFGGKPRIGVHATGALKPADFGLPEMFGSSIELVIDTEFEKAS
jgi:polyisoprenoid-binding protein YceI